MKISRIVYAALVSAATPCLVAAPAAAAPLERVSFHPWGAGAGEAGLAVVPDGRQGPQDFGFDHDGTPWLLDTQNGRAFPVAAAARAVRVQAGAVLISFEGRNVSTISAAGRIEEQDPARGLAFENAALRYPTAFAFHDGLPQVASGGSAVPLKQGVATAVVERRGLGFVTVVPGDGSAPGAHSIAFPGLVEITPLGVTDDGALAAEVQVETGAAVRRHAVIVSDRGKTVASIELPRWRYADARRDVRMAPDGSIHVMLSGPDGVEIWRWDRSRDASFSAGYLAATHSPTDGLVTGAEMTPARPAPAQPVTRSGALATAKSFNDHVWTASLKNITTTTCTDWCGKTKTVDPPDWVVEGQNTRFPYCWGGFSSVASFDQGLLADKKAGDAQTTYDTGGAACGSSCAVGVDCSGFVSQCWNAGSHYGTGEMDRIATAIQKTDLKPADALNNAGSHVRLFVATRADGNWDMVESYAGSGYWGVGYTVRSPASNANYDAIRYNLIQDDVPQPHDPPTIAHTPPGNAAAGKDVVISAGATTSTGNVAAFNLRYMRAGDVDWTIVVFADKGGGAFEATIPAASATPGTIEYYLAIWDGETPVQDGRNRVTLPADAETANHYFALVVEQPDAGAPDAGAPDAGIPDAGPHDAAGLDAGLSDAWGGDPGPADAGHDNGPGCAEGESRCADTASVEICRGGAWHAAAACGAGTVCANGSCVAAAGDTGTGRGVPDASGVSSSDAPSSGEGGCSCAVIDLEARRAVRP